MASIVKSAGWEVKPSVRTRGAGVVVSGASSVPPEFLTRAKDTEEFVARPKPATRGAGPAAAPGALDITCELGPDETAVLAVRHPSGALTFHAPRVATSRTRGGPTEVQFIAEVRLARTESGRPTSRGMVSTAVKAIVIKFGGHLVDAAAGWALSKLAARF